MNTTVNGSSCPLPFSRTAATIGQTFVLSLIFLASLVGNSFLALIVYKTPSMRKPINYLIVNMAMSDLLFPIFCFPRAVAELYLDSWLISGPLGLALCKLSGFFPNISTIVSIQSLVLIAVDRFGAAVFPLRSPLISSKMCPFFVLATWFLAVAIVSPCLVAKTLVKYSHKLECELQWSRTFGTDSSSFLIYTMSVNIVLFYIPVSLLAIVYSIIYMKIKSAQKIPSQPSINAERRRAKRQRYVLKMSIAIVLAFALCWLPNSITGFIKLLTRDSSRWKCSTRHYSIIVTRIMALLNCAINPLICFIFSAKYRHGLKKLLSCFKKSQRIIPAS